MYGNYKKRPSRGYKSKMSATKKAYLAGVKAGMARARKYGRTSSRRRWY